MALSNAPATATLAASDFARAKTFYTEKLGLKITEDLGPVGAIIECGSGTKLFLYESTFAGSNKATAVTFQVADIDAEMTELRGKGVMFEEYDMPGIKTENGVVSDGGMKSAWFKDSEGNILNLVQRM